MITIAPGSPASGICWKGKKMPTFGYEISLDAKRTEDNDFFCGMTLPIRESYCSLIVGGWGGTIVGLSNINGTPAVENESCTVAESETDRWYRIRLRMRKRN